MRCYKKPIRKILLALFIFLLLCATFDICWNWNLRTKLRYLRAETDTIIIRYNLSRDIPDVQLSDKEMKEFFSLLKLRRPLFPYFCACAGELRITFKKQGDELSYLTYHHDTSQVRGLDLPIGYIDIRSNYQQRLQHFFERLQFPLSQKK